MPNKWENGPHLVCLCPIIQFPSRRFDVRSISFCPPQILATAAMVANTRESGMYKTHSRFRAGSAPPFHQYIPISPTPTSPPPSLSTTSPVVTTVLPLHSADGNSYSRQSTERASEHFRIFYSSQYDQLDHANVDCHQCRLVGIFLCWMCFFILLICNVFTPFLLFIKPPIFLGKGAPIDSTQSIDQFGQCGGWRGIRCCTLCRSPLADDDLDSVRANDFNVDAVIGDSLHHHLTPDHHVDAAVVVAPCPVVE